MYCPNCRDEFRDELTSCPDCDEVLVAELPPEELGPLAETAVAMDVRSVVVLPLVESLLQDANIPYFIQGREALDLIPVLRARVLVPKDRCDEAKEVLAHVDEFPDEETEDEDAEAEDSGEK